MTVELKPSDFPGGSFPDVDFFIAVCQLKPGEPGKYLTDLLTLQLPVPEFGKLTIEDTDWESDEYPQNVKSSFTTIKSVKEKFEVYARVKPLTEAEAKNVPSTLSKLQNEKGPEVWHKITEVAGALAANTKKDFELPLTDALFEKLNETGQYLIAVYDPDTGLVSGGTVVSVRKAPEGVFIGSVWYNETEGKDPVKLEGSPFYTKSKSERIPQLFQLEIEVKGIDRAKNLAVGIVPAGGINKENVLDEMLEIEKLTDPVKKAYWEKRKVEAGDARHSSGQAFAGLDDDKFNLKPGLDNIIFYNSAIHLNDTILPCAGCTKAKGVLKLRKLDGKLLNDLKQDEPYEIFVAQVYEEGGKKYFDNFAFFTFRRGEPLATVKVEEVDLGIAQNIRARPKCASINECLAQLGQNFAQQAFK
jgi:hypothetical protein